MYEELEDDGYEGFQKELYDYLTAFKSHLAKTYTKATVTKYAYVISDVIDYLYMYCGLENCKDIKASHIKKSYYNFVKETGEVMTMRSVINMLKKYFIFIQENYGMRIDFIEEMNDMKV